ncbi:Retinol dehydrogenase 14 [Armadillidium vulgare]|nr:Retinol dehydrogenase 14 [Armadillidium vulgare]
MYSITVNCVAPGIVKTELYEKSPNPWVSKVMKAVVYFTGRSVEEGAQTHIYLAVSEDVRDVTGAFFMDCKERKGNRLMEDAGIIKKVWEASEELVQLTPQERSSRINPTI